MKTLSEYLRDVATDIEYRCYGDLMTRAADRIDALEYILLLASPHKDEAAGAIAGEKPEETRPFVWCVVAEPEGPEAEMRLGLKHLAIGARLYCFPWGFGDGRYKLRVLGRCSGGTNLIELFVEQKLLTNWRVQKVFHPFVVNAMKQHWSAWDDSHEGLKRAIKMVATMKRVESSGSERRETRAKEQDIRS
jgi:hypothetical protein